MSAWATSMFSFCSVMRRALGSFKVTSFRQSNGKTQLELPVPDLPLLSLLHEREGFMQTASVKWIGKQRFVASSPSGHAIPLDSDRESNKAPGPMELVLMALGACTATDVVSILEKKRQKLESLEIICSGERAKEPPTVWIKLEIRYRLHGQLDDAAVKHAIQLSEDKYCSVAAMLKKTAALSWRYEILPPSV